GYAAPGDAFAHTSGGAAAPGDGFAHTSGGAAAPGHGFAHTSGGAAAPGDGFEPPAGGMAPLGGGMSAVGRCRIDPGRADHYVRLLSELARIGALPQRVVHAFCLGAAAAATEGVVPVAASTDGLRASE